MAAMFSERLGFVVTVVALALCTIACQKEPEKVVVPDVFRVKFMTSQGDFTVEATKAWAPRGIDRFHELIRVRYFDEGRFFRVLPGFIAQFGHGKIDVGRERQERIIQRGAFFLSSTHKENTRALAHRFGRGRSGDAGGASEQADFVGQTLTHIHINLP